MSGQWYLSREGERYGPYSWEQLCGFAETGQVVAHDLVWSEGLSDWIKAAEVEGLFQAAPAAAQPAPPAPPVHPADNSGGEKMIGMIPAMQRKTGVLSTKLYNLVVTERRILFAEATTQMLNQAAKDAAAEAKAAGKGFFARAADTMRSSQRIYQKYWQISPKAILAETPGNFSIEYHDLTSIKIIQQGGFKIGLIDDDHDQQKKDEMHIKTNRDKIRLTFAYGNSREAKKLLRDLLGKTVR